MERRKFLAQAGAALTATSIVRADHHGKKEQWPIIVFEKPFQLLPYDRMGEALAKIGVQGIEATIRNKGHILPANVEDEVPKMVKDLAKNGQKALIAATHISEATPETEKILRVLKANGIERYRMDYYKYDLKGDLLEQVRDFKKKAEELAALNKEIGIQGLYQQHSGARLLGGLCWDLALLMEGIDPKHLGIAFDLRHSRNDSGLSWRAALQVCRKHIQSIYVKDSLWGGERSDKLKNVPLDTGLVNQKIFDAAREGLPSMPLSLHMEWGKSNIYPKDQVMDAFKNVERDLKTLKSWL